MAVVVRTLQGLPSPTSGSSSRPDLDRRRKTTNIRRTKVCVVGGGVVGGECKDASAVVSVGPQCGLVHKAFWSSTKPRMASSTSNVASVSAGVAISLCVNAAALVNAPTAWAAPPTKNNNTAQEAVQQQIPRFDPYTGEEKPWQFDPYTGKPLEKKQTTIESLQQKAVPLEVQPTNKAAVGIVFAGSAISLLSSVIWVEKQGFDWFDSLFPSISMANKQQLEYERQEESEAEETN